MCGGAAAESLTLAVEPTAYSFGSAALRLRFRRRLTASVRHEFHRSGKEVRQQQWSLAK